MPWRGQAPPAGGNYRVDQEERLGPQATITMPAPLLTDPLSPFSALHDRLGRAGGEATVDEENLAGDVGAGIGGQEHDRAVEVVGLSRPAQWDPADDVLDPLGVVVENLVLGGFEPARGQNVDRNAVLAPFGGQAAAHLQNPATTGAVRPDPLHAE